MTKDNPPDLSEASSLLTSDSARFFDRLQREEWYFEPHKEWLNSLKIQGGSKLLEVGTGPGLLAKYAQESYECDVIAVDDSAKMLERAGKSKVQFMKANAEDLPFENDEFDLVFSSSLINIVSNPEKVISEMLRVAKKGATISFLIPSENMNLTNAKEFVQKNNLQDFSSSALLLWATGARILSKTKMKQLLEENGYKGKLSEQYFFDNMLISFTIHK